MLSITECIDNDTNHYQMPFFHHTGFCSFFGVGFTKAALFRLWHDVEGFPLDTMYDLDSYSSEMYEFISEKVKSKGLVLIPVYGSNVNYDAFIGMNGPYISELDFLSSCGVPPIPHDKVSGAADELIKMGYEDKIKAFVIPVGFGIEDGVELFNGMRMEH